MEVNFVEPVTAIIPHALVNRAESFHFTQVFDGFQTYAIQKDEFLAAPFHQLCPTGDCFEACDNFYRVFQPVPSPFNDDWTVDLYGKPDANGHVNVTLFGLCTNLGNASDLAQAEGSSDVQSYFASDRSLTNPVSETMTTIAQCFADTCGQTRHPYGPCRTPCSTSSLLEDGVTSFDFHSSLLNCTQTLCLNHFVLPFANQDILGVGVSHQSHSRASHGE